MTIRARGGRAGPARRDSDAFAVVLPARSRPYWGRRGGGGAPRGPSWGGVRGLFITIPIAVRIHQFPPKFNKKFNFSHIYNSTFHISACCRHTASTVPHFRRLETVGQVDLRLRATRAAPQSLRARRRGLVYAHTIPPGHQRRKIPRGAGRRVLLQRFFGSAVKKTVARRASVACASVPGRGRMRDGW